jgi:RNA polymerase sigma factor (sigma-70 family)
MKDHARSKKMTRRNNNLDNAAGSSHLLTPQQERHLRELIAAGGEAAKGAMTQFVEANQGLVYTVARRFQGYGLGLEDLVQEGNIGLMRAIEKFDPARGFKFSTMAWWWIQQAMTREIFNTGRMIRLPVHLQKAMRRMNKEETRLASELDRLLTDEELAGATGFTTARVEALRAIPWTVSLDEPFGEEDDLLLESVIVDPSASFEERVTERMLAVDLEQILLSTLTPREYLVATGPASCATSCRVPATSSGCAPVMRWFEGHHIGHRELA